MIVYPVRPFSSRPEVGEENSMEFCNTLGTRRLRNSRELHPAILARNEMLTSEANLCCDLLSNDRFQRRHRSRQSCREQNGGRSDSTGPSRCSRRHRSRSRFWHPWRQSWLPIDEKHRFREFRENHDTELPYFIHPFNHLRMALGLLRQPCSLKPRGSHT